MKELMIHVERIVRPVRALQRRKLRIRQEMLTHLEAALEEERGKGEPLPAALEAAQRRLGEPAALTRTLQSSVPWAERALLGRVPLPSWFDRWEKKIAREAGTGVLTLSQAALLTLGSIGLGYGAVVLLATALLAAHGPEERLRALSEQYVLGNLLAMCLFLIFIGACFALVGVATRGEFRRAVGYGAWVVGSAMGWVLVILEIAAKRVEWREVGLSLAVFVVLVLALFGLGRLIHAIGRRYAEWLTVEIES